VAQGPAMTARQDQSVLATPHASGEGLGREPSVKRL
jgi:hypothetical protein